MIVLLLYKQLANGATMSFMIQQSVKTANMTLAQSAAMAQDSRNTAEPKQNTT